MNIGHHVDFLLGVLIVIVIVILSYGVFTRIIITNFFIGSFRFSHWLSIIGSIYIAVATPFFAVLKRQLNANWQKLVRFHMFSNLIFFGLIALHFSAQVGRPAANYPDLGTGVALFAAMSLQVVSGFIQRFTSQRPIYKQLIKPKTIKFMHASFIAVFYVVIIFHVLHGLGII